jgi:hypothetical protein
VLAAAPEALYLGRQHSELDGFLAEETAKSPRPTG